MPIQWSGRLTGPGQLAGVIAGEASSPAGQFAVASTMFNRLQSGNFGASISDVVRPSQFNGFNPNPGGFAQTLANALWNGSPLPGGDTGNSLFFAAKSSGANSWPWQNGLFSGGGVDIGGNFFSDQLGAPSSNFRAPNFTGDTSGVTANAAGNAVGDSSGFSVGFADSGMASNAGPLSGTGSTGAASAGGSSPAADAGGATPDSGGGGTSPAMPGSGQTQGTGIPLNITNAPNVGQQSADTLSQSLDKNTQTATQSLTSNTNSILSGFTNFLATFEQGAADLLIRGGIILLALVILAGAFAFYTSKSNVKIDLSPAK